MIKQHNNELAGEETREKGLLALMRLITRESMHLSTFQKFREMLGRLEHFSLLLIEQLWAQHTTTAEKDHAQ